jgi:hypothetical protein
MLKVAFFQKVFGEWKVEKRIKLSEKKPPLPDDLMLF